MKPQGGHLTRRAFTAAAATAAVCAPAVVDGASAGYGGVTGDGGVNSPREYPVVVAKGALECVVDVSHDLGAVDRRIFGTNLEWFNEGGGFGSKNKEHRERLQSLVREENLSVLRFPGGTLADYYDWRDGVGRPERRPLRRHPTDPGRSTNVFGSPEFFALLKNTGAEGLITVNVGTSTPEKAAAWIQYVNDPDNSERRNDGWPAPIGVKLWEVGNELYLPGSAGEKKITQTPEDYTAHFLEFAEAMRAADPNITLIAIGVAKSGVGPDTQYPDWTEKLLQGAASKIDMIAVHNAYFPLLYYVQQPSVDVVYPAMWAAPEAVERSLTRLSELIARYETDRKIGIAITEWGALFTLPFADPYWFDHVKTIGSGVYVARMLQVLLGQKRVRLANYFKFADRSFMGWVGFNGEPKVPYRVFQLFSGATGTRRIAASIDSPTYDTPGIGAVGAENAVAEVTVLATRDDDGRTLYVNFVNRSLNTAYRIDLRIKGGFSALSGELRSISAKEPTAHNGVDIPPELPMKSEYEPYSTATPGSIKIDSRVWSPKDEFILPPFSVATAILRSGRAAQ
jgi:alpha-N-arabinofuranosidase